MGIYTGNSKLKLYIGDSKVKKAYIGAARVYSSGNPVTYHVDSGITYTEEVEEGSSCLSPTTFTPAKSGWTFVGWRQDNAASGSTLSSLLMGDNAIALYAVFSRDVTITYYNGSAEALYTTKYKYYNNGNTANPAFTIPQASKSGWLERGWSVSASGNGSITYNSINNTAISSNITLYGMYQQTITVTYYNDSQSASHTTGTRYYNSNGNVANPSFTIAQAAKNGWTAGGWSTGTNADAEISYGSISGTEFSSGITLYGLYYKTVTLSYNGNGSTGGSVASQSGTSYYNSSGNIANPLFTLSANGFIKPEYQFSNWALNGTDGTQYSPGTNIYIADHTTVYAIWTAITLYIWNNGATSSYSNGWTGFTVDTTLNAEANPNNLEDASFNASSGDIDLTGFNYCTIVSTSIVSNHYGQVYVNVGFDSPSSSFYNLESMNTGWGSQTFTITLDISSLSGNHQLKFYGYANNESSYSGYMSIASLGISQIYLHN